MILSFQSLERGRKKNHCLALPEAWGMDAARADLRVPSYDVPAELLREALVDVVAAEPRSNLLRLDREARQAEFEQRSQTFGFRDRIVVEFVALEGGRSSLALYSRSLIGYYDFGVNRARIMRWLAALEQRLKEAAAGRAAGEAGKEARS